MLNNRRRGNLDYRIPAKQSLQCTTPFPLLHLFNKNLKQSFLDRCSSKLHSKLTRENCSDTQTNNLLIFSANFLWILLEKDVVIPKLTLCLFFLSIQFSLDLVRKGCKDRGKSVPRNWQCTSQFFHDLITSLLRNTFNQLSPSFYKIECCQSILLSE